MAKSAQAATTASDAAFAHTIKVSEESGERLYASFACFCWHRAAADADTAGRQGPCCGSRRQLVGGNESGGELGS